MMKKFMLWMCLLGATPVFAENTVTEVFNYESLMAQAQANPAELNEKLAHDMVLEIQPKDYKFTTFKNILILSNGEHEADPQKIQLLGLYFDNHSRAVLKNSKTVRVSCANNRAKVDQTVLISLEACKVL